MTPWCDDLVCSWRRLLADRHSLPFPWTLGGLGGGGGRIDGAQVGRDLLHRQLGRQDEGELPVVHHRLPIPGRPAVPLVEPPVRLEHPLLVQGLAVAEHEERGQQRDQQRPPDQRRDAHPEHSPVAAGAALHRRVHEEVAAAVAGAGADLLGAVEPVGDAHECGHADEAVALPEHQPHQFPEPWGHV